MDKSISNIIIIKLNINEKMREENTTKIILKVIYIPAEFTWVGLRASYNDSSDDNVDDDDKGRGIRRE